ncbi:hypothetical protein M1D80_00550 (plasmid) [Phyllobacteriaceae bacterium JZ32]
MSEDPTKAKGSINSPQSEAPKTPPENASASGPAAGVDSTPYHIKVQNEAPIDIVVGDEGSLSISPDGGSFSAYTWHELTATYTGTDERVTDIVWDAVQLAYTRNYYVNFVYELYQFEHPRTPLVDNGDGTKSAKTKFIIYGDFPYPGPDSVLVTAHTGDIDPYLYTRQAYGVEVGTPPSGNILSLCSLEGDPLATGKTFRFFEAAYSNYTGGAPSGNWDGTITWETKILSGPADTVVQLLSQEPTPGSVNGVRVKSSGSVRLEVTATATGTSDTRSIEVMFQKDAVRPGQLSWAIQPDDGSPLSLNQTHGLTSHSAGNFQGTPFWMRYKAYPSDKVNLERTWSYFGDWGWANNSVSSTIDIPEARIITGVMNNYWAGAFDHAQMLFSFRQDADAINVQPDWQWGQFWLESNLYTANTINATYSGSKTISQVWWSVDREENPDYTITFDPNPSPVTKQADGTLTTTTQIIAYGPNKSLPNSGYATTTAVPDCMIYAAALAGDQTQFTMGSSRTFFNATASVPPGNILYVESMEGNPLSQGANVWHVLRARYTQMDGSVVQLAPLTWDAQVTNGSGTATLAITGGGRTGHDGMMTNAINVTGTGPVVVTVTVKADKKGDTSLPLQLTFEVNMPALPRQGSMAITSKEDSLTFGQPNQLSVTYLDAHKNPMPDGTWVTWTGYPSDRLIFGDGNLDSNISLVSGGQGVATIDVTATAGADIETAVIATTAFNTQIGNYDHSDPDLTLSASKPQSVVGIEIDKASCLSTWGVDIDDDTQVIRCQAKLLNAGGKQTVMLPTTPPDAGVQMWDATTGEPLSMTNQVYTMETDADGVATFLIGSANNTYFSVNVQWKKFVSPTAQLAIVSGTGPLPPPTIVPAVRGGVLTIPSDAPFFQVTIPTSRGVLKGDPVALVLNNRVVWEGTVDPAVPIDVGYAALDLTGPNTLIYVTTGLQESGPASGAAFKTSGTPLTGPFGTGDRGLDMPTVVTKVTNAVGASDIMGQGLKIQVPRYADPAVGDVITVYCYLTKGTDVLSGDPWGNIVAVTYPVLKGDPLLTGAEQVLVPLPQWAIAGYANGDLQVDYKVVTSNGTSWSKIAPSATTYFDVNTTFG